MKNWVSCFLAATALTLAAIHAECLAADLNPWQETLPCPRDWASNWGGEVAQWNGRVYIVGSAYSGGDRAGWAGLVGPQGAITNWTQVSYPSTSRSAGWSAAAANGYLYAVGGMPAPGQYTMTTVDYAPINPDGTVGTWQTTSSLGHPSTHAPSVAWGNNLYSIGGAQTDSYYPNTVQRAAINANGSLGAWVEDASLMNEWHPYSAAVVSDGYIYAIGGGQHGSITATVERAQVLADGSLGPWSVQTSLPTTLAAHGAAVLNGTIYVTGGETGPFGGGGTNAVWSATIDPGTHDLGGWQTAASLPVADRYSAVAVGDAILAFREGQAAQQTFSSTPVPEPSSLVLLFAGLVGLLLVAGILAFRAHACQRRKQAA